MKLKDLILVALFAALTAVGAIIQIPMIPVQITLQTLFCIMAGLLLGPVKGALSQVVYLALGLFGVPVFTGGGGLAYVLKPSFGYLIGFVAGSFVSGFIAFKLRKLTFFKALFAALAGALTIYLIGVPYLYLILNLNTPGVMPLDKALVTGAVVFLPGDALKCIVAALVAVLVRPALIRSGYQFR